jgi:hypothetical protein
MYILKYNYGQISQIWECEITRWQNGRKFLSLPDHAISIYLAPIVIITITVRSSVLISHELGYRFGWFYNILRRTGTMSEEDKQTIEKELKVQFNYQELIKDDPRKSL